MKVPIREALNDPNLLGHTLKGPTWLYWRIMLTAAMGEALIVEERAIFSELTAREHEPLERVDEFVAVAGRRGGKSRAMSTLACYIACLCEHPMLVAGERGVVLLIAPNQRQAKISLDYAEATLKASPILRQLIVNRTAETLELSNGISIEVRPASFRSLRGPTYVCVIADEAAFWLTENSLNLDVEILNAVRPGLATTGGPLIIASSPYARKGVLWDAYNKHFGPNGDPLILVAHAASRTLNPSLSQRVVDRALEADHAHASAEYLAQFRTDIESFVSIEAVNACVRDYREIAPDGSQSVYKAFCDAAGGSGQDSFTLAIAHRHYRTKQIIVDAIRERRPPFSPEDVVNEFAALCKQFRVTRISGDKYAGGFPVELFRKHGLTYEPAEQTKSDLFRDLLPLINAGRIDLPQHARLISQLVGLERRTSRQGKDSISHPPNGHDDVANAVAGAAAIANASTFDASLSWVGTDEEIKKFNAMQNNWLRRLYPDLPQF